MAFITPASLSLRTSTFNSSSISHPHVPRHSSISMSQATATSEKSPAVPFLPKPENLDESMPGYCGFDPLNFSGNINVKWLQEGEIKNGRVAMLAFLGLLVQEFVHLPDPMFSNPVGTEALKQVPLGGWPQIFLFCGIVELVTMKGDYSYVQYADNADKHTPGDFGFNPLGLKADRKMREAEVKNGRLAMLGVGGVIHAMLLYKMPIVKMLTHMPTL